MASVARKSRGKCDARLWTKDKTMQLIALFESFSDLWDVSSQLYLDRKHKQKLLSEIAEKMEIDTAEIGAKLHNLRCQYNGELRKLKVKKSGSGTDQLYVPRWEFFNALKFLSNPGQSWKTFEFRSRRKSIRCQYERFGIKSPATSEAVISPSGSYRKRKGESKTNLQKDTLSSNAINILGTPADSHKIFADYVADQMRNMTEAKHRRLKLMIQKAIIEVEEEPDWVITPFPPSSSTPLSGCTSPCLLPPVKLENYTTNEV